MDDFKFYSHIERLIYLTGDFFYGNWVYGSKACIASIAATIDTYGIRDIHTGDPRDADTSSAFSGPTGPRLTGPRS